MRNRRLSRLHNWGALCVAVVCTLGGLMMSSAASLASCPCSIWPTGVPAVSAAVDAHAVELGVKFTSDVNGDVTGVRFYKGDTNTGTHVGNLWSAGGSLLATAIFAGESASGWQTVTFTAPVHVAAGTTYVASYHTNSGHYAYTMGGLTSQVDAPPLHALASGAAGGNGIYMYGATSQFPTNNNGKATNYWVDVTFSTTSGLSSDPMIWPTGVPAVASSSDAHAAELGVKFRSDVAGTVTGIRFYKGSTNTGAHVGSLWASDGSLLAAATFTSESASGWQTVTLPSPVSIAAGTTYVASYHTNVGHYAYTQGGLTNQVDNPPLHALAGSTPGGNGVYLYSATSQFPTSNNAKATNYWVDITFASSSTTTTTVSPTTTTTLAPTTTTTVPTGSAPAIDASSPAIVGIPNNVGSITSPTFSPPAQTVIYAAVSMDSLPGSGASVASVTNTGTALTWHLVNLENHSGPTIGGLVQVFWAYNATAQSGISVKGTFSQLSKNVPAPVGGFQVLVVDNAAANQTAAASIATWNVTSLSAPSATLTTTAPKSLVLAVFDNWDNAVTPTIPADQALTSIVLNPAERDTYWLQAHRTPIASPSAVTMNATAPSNIHWHEIAWEILGA